jgi:hypothetical protein
MKCYTGGPIEFLTKDLSGDNVPFNYERLTNFLRSKNVQVLNPTKIKCQGISEIKDRKKLFEEENFEEIRRQVKIIVRKDLRCVDLSDFTITYLPSGVRTTGGTHEVILANTQRKPTLLLCPEGIKHIPAWFFGIIPLRYMFASPESLMEYLEKVDRGEEIDDRWQFVLPNLTEHETGF